MWMWQEGEDYDAQQGASGPDRRRSASGRYCLGAGWGRALDHYVEYRLHLPLRYFQASLHLRYAREQSSEASLQVLLDGKPIGRPVKLPSTGGSGQRSEEWRIVSIPLGDVDPGEHLVRFQPATADSEIALDGFFLADPAFQVPPDFMRFIEEQERRTDAGTIPLEAKVRFHHVPRQNRRHVLPPFAQIDQALNQLPMSVGDTEGKPIVVSFSGTGRRKPNYETETVWHALRSESNDITPHAGKLGVFNPTTDMNYLVGFQIGARIAAYEPPDFAPGGPTRVALPNLLIEEAHVHEGIRAFTCFLPCGASSLLVGAAVENQTDDRKEIYVHQIVAKEPVAGRPLQQGVHTGQMRWIGYDNANDVTICCYDEWTRPDMTRPIGQVLCVLGSTERSVGHLFINDFGGALGRLHPIRYQGIKYRLSLPARSGQVILMALHLERYASTLVAGSGDGKVYVKRPDESAMEDAVRALIDTLELPWLDEVQEQIQRAQEAAQPEKKEK